MMRASEVAGWAVFTLAITGVIPMALCGLLFSLLGWS